MKTKSDVLTKIMDFKSGVFNVIHWSNRCRILQNWLHIIIELIGASLYPDSDIETNAY